jgi:glycosyltransferase involved in cell wall biosynthesis
MTVNILFVCNEYPPFLSGGIGVFVKNLAEELVQKSYQIVVAGMYAIAETEVTEQKGITLYRFPSGIQRKGNRLSTLWRSIQEKKKLSNHIEELIDRHGIRLVECFEWSGPLYRKPSVPLLVRLHGSHTVHALARKQKPSAWIRYWEQHTLRLADEVIAVSHYIAAQSALAFHIKRESIPVIWNSYRSDLFFSSETVQRNLGHLVFVGKFHERKGVFDLFRLLTHLLPLHASYYFTFIGSHTEPQRQQLLHMIPSEIQSRITFLPAVAQAELVDYYRKAAMVLVPTWGEAFGLIVAEAKACGAVVAMNAVSTATELIEDGTNGILFQNENPKESAEALHAWLQQPERMQTLRVNGLAQVTNLFSDKKIVEENNRFYQRILQSESSKNHVLEANTTR